MEVASVGRVLMMARHCGVPGLAVEAVEGVVRGWSGAAGAVPGDGGRQMLVWERGRWEQRPLLGG